MDNGVPKGNGNAGSDRFGPGNGKRNGRRPFLALIGVAPFALFMSEFYILKAALDHGSWLAAALFLFGGAVVFVGALRHVVSMAWQPADEPAARLVTPWLEGALVLAPLAALLVLGVWMPPPLRMALTQAASFLGGAL